MKLRVTSPENLKVFLKKLKVVEKSVIIEITKDRIFSKVHTPDKSVSKYTSISFSDALEGDVNWDEIVGGRVLIGILDITKLIDSFKYFKPEEDIHWEFTLSEEDDRCVADELKISSPSLNIKIRGGELGLFSYMDDNISDMVQSKSDYVHRFKLYGSDFDAVAGLCSMENDKDELLNFDIHKDKIITRGRSFDYTLNVGDEDIEMSEETRETSIYKTQLTFVDPETSSCYVHGNRIVFASEDTDTSTAVGLVEK